jgi:hypothetical protein
MKSFWGMLALSFALLIQVTAAQAATSLFVNPAHTDTTFPGSFAVDVDISSTDSIYAAQFDVSFDNTRLNATSVTEGSYLKQGGINTFCGVLSIDNSAGLISYACTRFNTQTGVTGSGILLTMNFDTLGAGTSNLALSSVSLVDPSLQPVPTTSTGGTVKVNQAPSASGLQIAPASPVTGDNLVGSYTFSDPDGDAESGSEIRWYKDSVHQSAYNDVLTVPSSATSKGESWHFTVRPSDGSVFGSLATSPSVIIGNTPPTAASAGIAPALPKTADDLVCTGSGSTDADGDSVNYQYAWYKDTILQSGLTTGTVSSGLTAKGQVWECVVTPTDGTGSGPTGSDSVTIQNTAPTIPTISVSPSSPTTSDNLYCGIVVDSYDADGDLVMYNVAWRKDGVPAGIMGPSVSSSLTSKGEVWLCNITAHDSTDHSPHVTDSVTIGNTPPTAPTVDVTPDLPVSSDDLTCSASGSTDIDGDSVSYLYAWYKDTVLQSGLTTGTVSSGLTGRGDIWKCEVTPNDGTDNGPTGEDSVTIQNLAPTINTYAPSSATLMTRTGFTLDFDHTSSDPDSDPLSYLWELDGASQATTSAWTFSPTGADCGSRAVDLTVSDGLLSDSQSWTVDVGLTGDVDDDRDVDIFDLAAVGLAYGSAPGDPNWDANTDINTGPLPDGTPEGDGTINIFDLAMVGLSYGSTC